MEYKQVIVIRSDLKMPKGKTAAQAAHASVESAWRAEKEVFKKWRAAGMKKIAVKVDSEKELHILKAKADQAGISSAIITDAGKTFVAPGTVTCLGIGPGNEEDIDDLTGNLKLL
jgi:PTH2 family peptidyl-tRNA hydrolase